MVTAPDNAGLLIRDVSKSFRAGNGRAVLALDRLSLDVAAGEMLALIGPSGCGKTTLLRLIAGLDRADAGSLTLGSDPIDGPGAERGLVFQDPTLFPWLTVRRNVEAGLLARAVLDAHRADADDLLRLMGLEAFADAYPHQLSGGMAQRAALARALVNRPRLLLLDEPLGALDQLTRMRMQDEVLSLRRTHNTTMLLVTHDIDEAIYLCDRIALVTPRPGRIDRILDIPLPRPRLRTTPPFLELRASVLDMLHVAGLST